MSSGSSQTLNGPTYLYSIPDQKFFVGWKNKNLPFTWVIFFKLIFRVMTIPRKQPTHKQWNFFGVQKYLFWINGQKFSMRNTRAVVIQKKLHLQWSSKPNYCADGWGVKSRVLVLMLSYLKLSILLFYTVQAHRCWMTRCLECCFFTSCMEKQKIMPM